MTLSLSIRDVGQPALSDQDPVGPPPARGIQEIDESLGGPDSEEFELAGAGNEATTSSTTFETVAEYKVDRHQVGFLVEASATTDTEGEFRIRAGGITFGPFTGATDVSVTGDQANLGDRGRVIIDHRSQAGNSTTTKALIVAQEV